MSYIRHKIVLTLCLPTPTLQGEQGFAGYLTAGSYLVLILGFDRLLHAQGHSAPCCCLMRSRFRFARPSASDASETHHSRSPAPCSGQRCRPCLALQHRFPAWRFRRNALCGLSSLQHQLEVRRNSEFRRVSQRFAERAYRMAFSLASNASSWRILNG